MPADGCAYRLVTSASTLLVRQVVNASDGKDPFHLPTLSSEHALTRRNAAGSTPLPFDLVRA